MGPRLHSPMLHSLLVNPAKSAAFPIPDSNSDLAPDPGPDRGPEQV